MTRDYRAGWGEGGPGYRPSAWPAINAVSVEVLALRTRARRRVLPHRGLDTARLIAYTVLGVLCLLAWVFLGILLSLTDLLALVTALAFTLALYGLWSRR